MLQSLQSYPQLGVNPARTMRRVYYKSKLTQLSRKKEEQIFIARTGKKGQRVLQVLAQKLIKAYNRMGYVTLLDTRFFIFLTILDYEWFIP